MIELYEFDLDARPASAFVDWLDPVESTRATRLASGLVRDRFIVGRGMMRHLLAKRMACHPREIALETDRFDKPCLTNKRLSFNLSHSRSRALLAIGDAGLQIGVDLESSALLGEVEALAQQCLSDSELAQWARLASADRADAFLRLWVRKEACLKALGLGLQVEPSAFSCGFDESGDALFVQIGPQQLRMVDLPTRNGCMAALALAGESGPPVWRAIQTACYPEAQ